MEDNKELGRDGITIPEEASALDQNNKPIDKTIPEELMACSACEKKWPRKALDKTLLCPVCRRTDHAE